MSRDKLIGSWDLVDFRYVDKGGHVDRKFAPETSGLLIYTEDGYMSAAIHFVNADGSVRPMFYAGPLDINDGHNIHHVEFSNDPDLVGTTQKRGVAFDGDQLILTNEDSIVGGAGVRAEIVWRRH